MGYSSNIHLTLTLKDYVWGLAQKYSPDVDVKNFVGVNHHTHIEMWGIDQKLSADFYL